MDPGIRPGQLPPFHELDEYAFQDLCRDLLDVEDGIATCDVYGKRGQPQDGIDLLAHRAHGVGIEVGQCKCYQTFPPAKIRAASEEFFNHWERWSKEGVRRFVLFVACDLDSKQCQDEILAQTRRFRENGVAYEAWSGAKLRNKLRPHRDIVSTYLTPAEHWVRVICGEPLPPTMTSNSPVTVVISSMVESRMGQLADRLTSATERDLEKARVAWREGRGSDAANWVTSVKNDEALWSTLAPAVKAKVLRFEASLELRGRGDLGQARSLADEAHRLAPAEDETRLRALIAREEGHPGHALALLESRTDRDSRELRAAFLLEVGRKDEAWALLDEEDVASSTEGLLLRTLAYLAEKRIDAAHVEIQKALTLQPRWEGIRLVAAITGYYSSLSPVALPAHVVPWPEPVEWRLIRQDDEAQKRLRDAAKVFAELALQAAHPKEQRQIETWHLASLLNDPRQQDEAVGVCRTLLEHNPDHEGAVLWAVARHLGINLKPSMVALQQKVERGGIEPSGILALASIHLFAGAADRVQALLEQTRTVFDHAGLSDIWAFWWAQALTAGGRPEEALAFVERLVQRPAVKDIALLALRALDDASASARLMAHLEKLFQATEDPGYLLEACCEMTRRGAWAYVADRAEQLLAAVCTPEALQLAAICTHNTGSYQLCLKLLDEHRRLFPHGRLTGELRRVRTSCLERLGALPDATRAAEELAREEPTLDHHLRLASLLVAGGDLKHLSLTVREIESHPELDVNNALSLARTLRAEDPRLAAQLWRHAVGRGVPDELVSNAVVIAYELGLDHEVSDLVRRMQTLGLEGRGGVEMRQARDLPSFAEQRRQTLEHLDKAYRHGEGPVHTVVAQANVPLVSLYHRLLVENELVGDPANRSFLLIRYGGRPVWPVPKTKPARRLWLDVTAVLLAAHLEILDAVERAFKPLGLPPTLIPALLKMRDNVQHHQPGRLQVLGRMIELVDLGKIKVAVPQLFPVTSDRALGEEVGEDWVALFDLARARSGYLVDFLPVRKRGPSFEPAALPDACAQSLASCWSVIEALTEQGLISETVHSAALEAMGASGSPDGGAVPRAGAALFFQGNTPELLISANVMDAVFAHFDVYVEHAQVDRVRAELHDANHGRDLSLWVHELIERLRRGLTDGTYERLPVVPVENAELGEARSLAERCFLDLMALKPNTDTVAWIDDRYLLRYTDLNVTPMVGVLEVLGALVGAGELSSESYFEKLAQLRAANAAFIPFTVDEILYHLRGAKILRDKVVETAALRLLRQSWAACLLRSDMLQRAGSPNEPSELPFVFGSEQAIATAMAELWKDTSGDEAIHARADWLLREMHVDLLGLVHVLRLNGIDQGPMQLAASEIAMHIRCALVLDAREDNGRPSARRRYLQWLLEHALARRLRASPALLPAVADQVKVALLEILHAQQEENRRVMAAYLCHGLVEDLPELLGNEIERDAAFLTEIGRIVAPVITIGDLQFEIDGFWAAAFDAVNGRESRLTSLERHEVTLRPCEGVGARASIALVRASGETVELDDPAFELLHEAPSRREAVLRLHKEWIDVPDAARERAIVELASMSEPAARMRALWEWRNQNAALFYGQLSARLRTRAEFSFDDLRPPSADALIHHHRLDGNVAPDASFIDLLDSAAATLVREVGLLAALLRLTGLPVPLPSTLRAEMSALSAQKRRALFQALVRSAGSPISRIHLVRLLWAFRHERRAYGRLALRIAARALRDGDTKAFRGFAAMLAWASADSARWPDAHTWPAHVRLALVWSHTHHLYAAFQIAGAPEDWLHEPFERHDRLANGELFRQKDAYWSDVAHPGRFAWLPFTLSGLAYALESATTEELGSVHQLATGRAFDRRMANGALLANPILLQDPTLATNGMGSFLGWDRDERFAPLLVNEHTPMLSRLFLEQFAGYGLEQLRDPCGEASGWFAVTLVLGNLPVYMSLATILDEVLKALDIVALLKRNHRIGRLALRTASAQVVHLREATTRTHLRDQWLEAVAELSKHEAGDVGRSDGEEDGGAKATLDLLLATASDIASAAVSPDLAVSEFAALLSRMLDLPELRSAPSLRGAIERLCMELSPDQSSFFWPLLMRLRAELIGVCGTATGQEQPQPRCAVP